MFRTFYERNMIGGRAPAANEPTHKFEVMSSLARALNVVTKLPPSQCSDTVLYSSARACEPRGILKTTPTASTASAGTFSSKDGRGVPTSREKDSLAFTSALRRADRRACYRHSCARQLPPSLTSTLDQNSPRPGENKKHIQTKTSRIFKRRGSP